MIRKLKRLAAVTALVATAFALAPLSARAADLMTVGSMQQLAGRTLNVGLNKSLVLELPEDVRDVLVASPTIADVVVRTPRTLYLIGMGVGETNIILFGADGSRMAEFDVIVDRDTDNLARTIAQYLPGTDIQAETLNGTVVLSGNVASPEEASRAAQIAATFIGDPDLVLNMLQVAGTDQVNLRVTVAEVQREAAQSLGINLAQIVGDVGSATVRILQTNPLGLTTAGGAAATLGVGDFSGTLSALGRNGVLRTLAEPNLTAISGETANFLVGGEIPFITGRDPDTGAVTVEYKEYGISLSFTPVVLSGGRISLRVATEVSEIDPTTTAQGIPGFRTRRADTTVELSSGGSIALAGLISDTMVQTVNGIPGLMDVPVLGALFRSTDYQRSQSELVIFVTPYLVDQVTAGGITRPDQNYAPAGTAQQIFLNQLNQVYAVGAAPTTAYQGTVGFVFE